jgi:hypothetical protein
LVIENFISYISLCLLLISLKKEKEKKFMVLELGWPLDMAVEFYLDGEKNKERD